MKKCSINTESKMKQMTLIVFQVVGLVTQRKIISNAFKSQQLE